MKSTVTPLLFIIIGVVSLLTSCTVIPPVGMGPMVGGGVPPAGGLPFPNAPKSYNQFEITSIQVYYTPVWKTGKQPWDGKIALDAAWQKPDVFAHVRSGGRVVFRSNVAENRNYKSAYVLHPKNARKSSNRNCKVQFFDRDKNANEQMGTMSIQISPPLNGQHTQSKLYNQGGFSFRVNTKWTE